MGNAFKLFSSCTGLNVFFFEAAVIIQCCKVLVFGRNDTSFISDFLLGWAYVV